jgi:hypothetical protein
VAGKGAHSARDFESEVAALRRELDQAERWKAVYALCGLETDWALSIAGLQPTSNLLQALRALRAAAPALDAARARDAETHLAQAQRWQEEIASWATSGAEGLAGMYDVRVLQLARAWLLSATDDAGRKRALQLCAKVEHDANGVPSGLRAQLRAVLQALA